MNDAQQRYYKRAIANYGLELVANTMWFIDAGRIYYGKQESNGEISDYLSGYISGNTFVVEYTTDNDGLDTNGWDSFIKTHLELNYIDVRYI